MMNLTLNLKLQIFFSPNVMQTSFNRTWSCKIVENWENEYCYIATQERYWL